MRNLRRLRTRYRITQRELARRAELCQAYVSQIERGKKNPTYEALRKLARALGVSVAELVQDESLDPTGTEGGNP